MKVSILLLFAACVLPCTPALSAAPPRTRNQVKPVKYKPYRIKHVKVHKAHTH